MKTRNLILILALNLNFLIVYSQNSDSLATSQVDTTINVPVSELTTEKSPQEKYDYYMLKSKRLGITGGIFLGVGLVAIVALVVGATSESDLTYDAAGVLFLVGSISTIISIPILITSGSNKRKAKAFVGIENLGLIGNPYSNTKFISVGLSINL